MIFIKAFKMVVSTINDDQERIKGLILSCEDRAFHWYLVLNFDQFWQLQTKTSNIWGKNPLPILPFTYYSLQIKFLD